MTTPNYHKTLIVFDFDGTLCDSLPTLIQAINELPKILNIKKIQDTEGEHIRSLSSREIMNYLNIRWYKIPLVISLLKKSISSRSKHLKLFDGIAKSVQELKNHEFELSILSSNSYKTIQSILSRDLANCFSSIRGDCGPFKKSKKLDEIRNQNSDRGFTNFVYVGDETRDIHAAKKAGFYSVGVTWGYNNHESISSLKPDLVIQEIEYLSPLLKKSFS